MIAMGVRDKDVGYALAAHGIEQRRNVSVVVGPRIEERNVAAADYVTDGAFEREWPRIVGGNRAHLRSDLLGLVRDQIEAFIERDVFSHPDQSKLCRHSGAPCVPRRRRLPQAAVAARAGAGGGIAKTNK